MRNCALLLSTALILLSNRNLCEAQDFSSLHEVYEYHCVQPSDINEHIPTLRELARQCASVAEIGLRNVVSTWGILMGLSESSETQRFYIGVDLELPLVDRLKLAQKLAQNNKIVFQFWLANDLNIEIPFLDMLFIDSLHTYCHLTYELEKFSPYVNKFIAMHDTSPPWGYADETYRGNYEEYPVHINKHKRGLWRAIKDFLEAHPEWKLCARYTNNNGFTILERVE